jgi:hypothetical protein
MDKKVDEFVCIKTFATRHEADVGKSVLDANHIASYVQADDAGGMYPFMTERIKLFIQKTNVLKAQKVLQ